MRRDNFGGAPDYKTELNKNTPVAEFMQKIAEILPVVELAGHDIAAAHLQAAFDVLSNILYPTSASSQGVLIH